MSAASTPPPRTKSRSESSSSRPARTRQSFFLPIFIYLVGAGSLASYHVMATSDQVDQLTQTVDNLDAKVKRAQYEKMKFFHIAGDVLRLAARDPNAETVALRFKLHKLQAAEPELFGAAAPSEIDVSGLAPSSGPGLGSTNLAPIHIGPMLTPTNAASSQPANSGAGAGTK